MNKTIKTIINVLPIFLVPLILERKRFKQHPDVQKVTKTTVNTTKTVAHQTGKFATTVKDSVVSGSSQIKDNIQMKKRRHDYNKAMKKEAEIQRYYRPENVRQRGKTIAKDNRKEIDKMAKNLEKHIAKRHKEEDKANEKRQKQMIKNMQKMQKYEVRVGHTPGQLDEKTEKRGDKLEQQNKKEIEKMNKKFKKHLEQRHKEEEKVAKERAKTLKNNMKAIQHYEKKAGHTPNQEVTSTTTNETKSTVGLNTQSEQQRITTLSELQTTTHHDQPAENRTQPTAPGQVNHQNRTSPLFDQHYQKMAQHVEESKTLRQDSQLNETSQKSMDKQKR